MEEDQEKQWEFSLKGMTHDLWASCTLLHSESKKLTDAQS
jgi:hypothetical protein